VFVASTHSNLITVIDGARNIASETLPVEKSPYALAADETTGKVYCADLAGGLTALKP
jgi:YVTN family beta-propeller protein